MKTLLLLLFFAPVLAFGQCQLKKSTDPFTHETKLSTGFMLFHKGALKLQISMDATPALLDFFFWIPGEQKCFDDQSYAEVVYDGEKSKMRLKNTGSMNCEGAFHFSFKNQETPAYQLNKMASKKINYISVFGTGKAETVITFTEEQKDAFMRAAECVLSESKTLLSAR